MVTRYLYVLAAIACAPAWGRVDNFLLLDERGAAQEAYYHGDAPAIVLASHAVSCNATRKDDARIDALHKKLQPSGVVFYYIDPVDSRSAFADRAPGIPVLLDETQIISKA